MAQTPRWSVEFYRATDSNPVVEELLYLRKKDVKLATEVVQDLKDLEEFGLALPEKRLHKIRGTELWELRTRWQHRIARSLFFEAGGRLLVVTTIFQKKSQAIPKAVDQARRRTDGGLEEGADMKLQEFIEEHVMTDPEWRDAYDDADATREAARAIARARLAAGLSQAELAERSGTAQAVISRIERGVVSPSLDTFGKIARGLGLKPVVTLEAARTARRGAKQRTGAAAKRKGA